MFDEGGFHGANTGGPEGMGGGVSSESLTNDFFTVGAASHGEEGFVAG